MPLKKSALLLIIVSVCSVSLLAFSSAIKTAVASAPGLPVKCTPAKCCIQVNDPKPFSPLEMISEIMLRSAA